MSGDHIINAVNDRGTIYFDAQCGMCSAGVRKWESLLSSKGFGLKPLQLLSDQIPDQMLMHLPDRSELHGVDVFAYVSKYIWWAFPLHLMLQIPLVHEMGKIVYQIIADRRKQISAVCRLTPMQA